MRHGRAEAKGLEKKREKKPLHKREKGARRVECRKCKQENMKTEKRPSSTLFMHYACMYVPMYEEVWR